MELQQIQQLLAIAQGLIWILALPLGIWLFIQRGQKTDSDKIIASEKIDIGLMAKFDLIVLEIKHLTDAIMLIKQNDLHTITEKQKDQDSQINKLTVSIEKMATIIEERVPRKTVNEVT